MSLLSGGFYIDDFVTTDLHTSTFEIINHLLPRYSLPHKFIYSIFFLGVKWCRTLQDVFMSTSLHLRTASALMLGNWSGICILILHCLNITIMNPWYPFWGSTLRQCCDDNTSDTGIIENIGYHTKMGCSPQSGTTPLFSVRGISLASLQRCRSVDGRWGSV